MEGILLKAGSFLLIILAGYTFKQIGLLKASDAHVLRKIMLNLTLPCVMVGGIKSMDLQLALIVPLIAGFVVGPVAVAFSLLVTRKKPALTQAMYIINFASFNIGGFLLPILSAFFPASAVSISSIFDIGNGVYGTGGIFAFAQCKANTEAQFRIRDVFRSILNSTTLMVYIPMLILFLCGLRLPDGFYTLVQTFGNSNMFLSFFIIGLMLEIKLDLADLGEVFRALALRYIMVVPLALIMWLLPIDTLVRQVLVLCMLTPFSSVSPSFCAALGCKPEQASIMNALSLIISLVIVTVLMLFWQM